MRVANWKADQIFHSLKVTAAAALGQKAEEAAAEIRLTVAPKNDQTFRRPRFQSPNPNVSFTVSKGRRKGKQVSFRARRWMGRYPGGLKSTIRVLEREGRMGNFRVIVGNFKVYWAKFAEYGVPSRNIPRSLFMRNAFNRVAPTVKAHIEKAVK